MRGTVVGINAVALIDYALSGTISKHPSGGT